MNREHYFCFGSPDTTVGAVDEKMALAMYIAYRCTAGATLDRHAYYAAEELTALILAGSETSAEVSVTPADLPSPTGVAYLARPDGALLLLWQVLNDDLLSVQLVPAAGVQSVLAADGELKAGCGYRFINHVYRGSRSIRRKSGGFGVSDWWARGFEFGMHCRLVGA